MRRPLVALCLLVLIALPALAGEFTLVAYNILNYPGSTGAARAPYFRTVLTDIAPDVMVCEEVVGTNGRDYFLNNVLEVMNPGEWSVGPFADGPDSDRAIYFKTDLFSILDSGNLATDLRTIDWWLVEVTESGDQFYMYSLHLKASTGSTNEARRLSEVTVMRAHMDTLPDGVNVIVGGDFNIYYSDEPAWQYMRGAGFSQLLDPINTEGYWHNNISYAPVHTQSPRTLQFGGGANGGMDDRFDFILCNDDMQNGDDLEILPATYKAFGNDGNHFNLAIIDGTNGVVTAEVANALHEASDHLPVVVNVEFTEGTPVPPGADSRVRLDAYPNPFNPKTRLAFTIPAAGEVELAIFDVTGRRLATVLSERREAGSHGVEWRAEGLSSGLYLARLSLDGVPLAMEKLALIE